MLKRIPLIAKHVAVSLLGVAMVMLLAWWVIDHLAANYFMGLMKEYHIDPRALHTKFLDAAHRSLLLSTGLGLILVGALSFFITKKVLRALTEMLEVTRKLAVGDYTQRVRTTPRDEVGELGAAFNQMVESLQKIEAMRKDLVANVAHELRTPLHNMRGQLEAIQDRLLPPSRETVASLHEEVLRLVRLTEALHRLTQMDAAKLRMDRKKVNLQTIIETVVGQEAARLHERGLRVKMEIAPVWVVADSDQISQALFNLIENVIQYTPEGGLTHLRTREEGDSVRVAITNSGEGIAPEDLPHIFERFYRGEKSRSRESGGAGIGLSIVQQIIEAHGGRVGARSEQGETEIWFTLPTAK
jgi:signal transduction histidine kinase